MVASSSGERAAVRPPVVRSRGLVRSSMLSGSPSGSSASRAAAQERLDARTSTPSAVIEATKREWGRGRGEMGGESHVWSAATTQVCAGGAHPTSTTVDPEQALRGASTRRSARHRGGDSTSAEDVFPHLLTGSKHNAKHTRPKKKQTNQKKKKTPTKGTRQHTTRTNPPPKTKKQPPNPPQPT